MAYFAVALTRDGGHWSGTEVDLTGVYDLDSLVDQLRELGDDPDALTLFFVEEDDEWLGIVRVQGDADARVFLSDGRFVEESRIAAMIYQAPEEERVPNTEDEDESRRPEAEPAGDVELLADLGVTGKQLLDICAEEGALPSDIASELCEEAGCLDPLERLRGA